MKCIECGHELKDGAVYCIRCGAMQVSMDGSRLESKQNWPEVEHQAGGSSNWKAAVDQGANNAGRHTREFKPAPSGNGRRIAAVVAGLVLAAGVVGGIAYSAMSGQTSGDSSTSASVAVSQSTETESSSTTSSAASSSASSTASTSKSSTSATTSSKSSASAASSASSASASSTQSAAQDVPTIVGESQQQTQQQQQPQATWWGDEPSYAPAPSVGDYVLGDSSSRYYSRSELQNMSVSDLYYARNEIFARHGRMFHRTDLQEYFNSKSWYTPIYTPEQWDAMGNPLSDVEQKNTTLMREVEAAKGSAYL